ncbi:zona pellucida sperm-binding protein 3-like isoform X1 [Labrus mixtus]|uniref:zona pellucida sperm-binding protein 3-like isoform X1 n=1 Tax=Labrus mixtus TaxID=508554 RepID=UPI0029BFF6FC|nr:zona pellucida sperm-binding protein 3-like isoform X1 [Labrus mixtus]
MLFVLVFFAVSLLETMMCYTYRTKPLFLSFSELAALEENSLKRTHSPSADQRLKKTFVLKCHEDSIEVTMKARLFHPALPVEPEHFRLGPVGASVQRHCTAKVSGNGDYIIRAPLTDCGSEVMLTQSALLYRNLLLYWPPSSPGDWQKRGAAVSVHCEYRRRYTVSSRAPKPTWSPLISIQSELLDLDFQLRLMTDDWSGGRRSPVYFLGETVNIEASVDHPHHPLRLFVNGCAAALSSEVNSYPRYAFIDHQGCFTDSQLHNSSSRFLPRVQDEVLQIQLQTFLFHQDHRHTIYITCHLEAEPISNKDQIKKACSFINGRWRSVDGDDRVCESCGSSTTFNHKGAPRSQTQLRPTELQKETSLGPVMFLTKNLL